MTRRKSFVIHIDSLDILDDLTDEQAGQLFKAIKSHQLGQQESLSPLVKIAFSPFRNQFARDDEKYQKIVERNKNNGLKGGRPKTQDNPDKPSGLSGNPDNPSKADSVNDSDSGSGSKSDSDSKDKLTDSIESAFNIFYSAGLVKKSKQSALRSFKAICKNGKVTPEEVAGKLAEDIKKRIAANQFGIGQLHPSTYLNGRRWEDEITQSVNSITASNHNISSIDHSNSGGFAKGN